jgi:Ribbon-helix-helix protein, copG family
MLQLNEDQISRLDAEAARVGQSRSQLVRNAVDAQLNGTIDVDLAERYRLAYADGFGVDEWGDLDAWHAAVAASRTENDRPEW